MITFEGALNRLQILARELRDGGQEPLAFELDKFRIAAKYQRKTLDPAEVKALIPQQK